MLEVTSNHRGFMFASFNDANGVECSIQESSAMCCDEKEGSYLWLGVDDANPQIMASQAHKFGVQTTETTGWVPYPVPNEVSMTTRMHLTQRQIKKLLPLLKHFAKHGILPTESKKKKKK
jgi:hypothetical protein